MELKKEFAEYGMAVVNGEIYKAGEMILGGRTYTWSEVSALRPQIRKAIEAQMRKSNISATERVWAQFNGRDALVQRDVMVEVDRQRAALRPENRIEGLAELQAAIRAENEYSYKFRRMMEDESNDGAFAPRRPKITREEVASKYPRAAAYIRADGFCNASNADKSAAGRRAMERILAGEEWDKAIADMEAEWSAAAQDAAYNK